MIQIIEIIETYREIAADLIETYMSLVSNWMNEIMKVLTLISAIFIPDLHRKRLLLFFRSLY